MRLLALSILMLGAAWAQTVKIPPVKTSIDLEGQPVEITAWGTVSPAPSGVSGFALTVDLGNFQEKLTPVMAAQLNHSDRCGERLSVDRAELATAAPSSVLTATVHYERYGCAKALGKEIVKKLVGGNAVVEVNLTPSAMDSGISLTAKVLKIDADGSLGEMLRSGSFGDSIRKKVETSIESAIQKATNLKGRLPAALENSATLETVQFADGGGGRLWLAVTGTAKAPVH